MLTELNPFEPPRKAEIESLRVANDDASIGWFVCSLVIFLTASNAYFATNGIWYSLVSDPLSGSFHIAILAALCTLTYFPASFSLRKLLGYRYVVPMALLSGFMYSVGDRLMRHFQTQTGVNYFVVNVLICLACTLPAEVVLGLIWRAITNTRRGGRTIHCTEVAVRRHDF